MVLMMCGTVFRKIQIDSGDLFSFPLSDGHQRTTENVESPVSHLVVAISTLDQSLISNQSLIPQISLNLNLYPHRLKTQAGNPNLSPDRVMIRTQPLLKIAHYS